jgi:acyl carrier protein
MNFLDLLNAVTRQARPAHRDFKPMDSMDLPFTETEVDSLDSMMIVMYLAIIYGITDDECKDFHPKTPRELLEFIEHMKSRDPASIEEAMEMIK